MNCKQGDLAIVVRSRAGNEGRIVRCIRLSSGGCWFHNIDGSRDYWSAEWEIDQLLLDERGDRDRFIADHLLRPIRDPGDDAVDETLLRLPSPRQEVTA